MISEPNKKEIQSETKIRRSTLLTSPRTTFRKNANKQTWGVNFKLLNIYSESRKLYLQFDI